MNLKESQYSVTSELKILGFNLHEWPIEKHSKNEDWIKKVLEDPKVFLRVSIHLEEVEDIIKKFNHPKVIVTKHHTGQDRWFNSISTFMYYSTCNYSWGCRSASFEKNGS